MAANLGTLTLDLVAKIGGFMGPLDKAARGAKKTSTDIAKAGKAMGVAIGAGAVAAAAGIAVVVGAQLELIDAQAKSAQQLQTTFKSLTNLGRAGELAGVGMEKIEAASRQLNLNIGRAIQGTEAQVAAFDRLGLSAQEIANLPLDQRILTINAALVENVQASERAAVAAELFGAKNAASIQMIDAATIEEAARQVEIFGLNLDDLDAAKVEMAGDALSTFGLIGDGIAKQLTVELAPALQAVGDLFLESAEEAGGLGTVVQDSVRKGVNALAFIVDAADGVKRAFEVTADAIIFGIGKAVSFVTNNTAGLLAAISVLPGVDYSDSVASLREFSAEANGIAAEAAKNIDETLSRPLAGENFRKFYDDAQAAAQAAAEAAIEGRAAVQASGEAFVATEDKKTEAVKETRDAIVEQINALQLQVRALGMTADEEKLFRLEVEGATKSQLAQAAASLQTIAAFEEQKKAQEDYKDLVAELRTEEEQRNEVLREQLKVLDAMQGLSGTERDSVAGRIAGAATEDVPEFSGLAPEIGGAFGEFAKLDDAEKELEEWYANQLIMLDGFRAERADLSATWDAEELTLKQQHEDAMAQIEQSRRVAGLNAMGDFFGQLSALRDSDSKKGRALGKAAAIAQATINAYTAATGAYASASAIPVVGWVLGPIAAGVALAAGMANVAAIKGQAHDGIMSVPSSGTWNLEKGERVTTAETSAKLDATLARIQADQAMGSGSSGMSTRGVTVNQNIQVQGRIDRRTSSQIATDASRKQRQAQARFGG